MTHAIAAQPDPTEPDDSGTPGGDAPASPRADAERAAPAAPRADAGSAPSLTVRRLRERQEHDPAVLHEILADGIFAHVAIVRDGVPVVLPFLYGVGDLGRGPELLLHGSTGGGLFLDAGDDGVPVSVAVTHLDGLVYARSLFDSSANYRSAMIFGRATPVPAEQQEEALWMVSDHVMPGRRAEVRELTRKEVSATQVLRVPLDRASVKVRAAGPGADPGDGEDHAVWAGVLPLAVRPDASLTDPSTTEATPVPASVTILAARLTARAATRRARLASSLPQPWTTIQ